MLSLASPPAWVSAASIAGRAADLREGFGPHQLGKPAPDVTFVLVGKTVEQHFRDDQAENPIAEKLEALIINVDIGAGVGQGALQEVQVLERMIQAGLKFAIGAIARHHSTRSKMRENRVALGHRHGCSQPAVPSVRKTGIRRGRSGFPWGQSPNCGCRCYRRGYRP